jgi:hypothetical protein
MTDIACWIERAQVGLIQIATRADFLAAGLDAPRATLMAGQKRNLRTCQPRLQPA